MRFDVVTLFPDMFNALTGYGISRRAFDKNQCMLQCWNPRDYTEDVHQTVDDRPYGGGPGMVMRFEPLMRALCAARAAQSAAGISAPWVVYMSPQGALLDQQKIQVLHQKPGLILLAGRYEGVDERFVTQEIDEELSIGDYVLSGGELPAMVVIDALVRQIPGVLHSALSAQQDSFCQGLLDYPHYTRPECVDGVCVPPVLLSGHHQAIARWRLKQSLGRTWLRRPALFEKHPLTPEDAQLLSEFKRELL